MGSSSKKYKEKESRKRRHRSPSRNYEDNYEVQREKRHKHKKHHHHHKEKRREKSHRNEYESDSSDVVEVVPDETPSAPPTKTKAKSPESSGQGVESLSIDETNKLRAKLGLKPLDVPSSSSSSSNKVQDDGKRKDDLGEFYHKPAENLQEKARQEKVRAKLSEIKEKRQLHNKYSKVKTLGESDNEDDVESWVKKSKKIVEAKKEAEKRAKMLEELDAQFGVSEVVESEKREKMCQKYTERDLRGLAVEHDLNTFAEERTVVLTLKDRGVLDEDDDVLVNVNMLDDERYKKVSSILIQNE